jgi:hypothetical protein
MNKLYLGKINLSKIDKEKIFEGKTGKWIDVTIWINEEPDKYGNSMSIEQSVDKGDDKIYLGNAKEWSKKEKAPESKLGRTTAPDEDENLPF